MRVVADTGRCVGAGQCVLTEPGVFDQDEHDGTVVIRTEHVDDDNLQRVREAVHICPSQALALSEDSTGSDPTHRA
ncbi:MAG: ferredoxin [Pseudonocardiaceae bacterium]